MQIEVVDGYSVCSSMIQGDRREADRAARANQNQSIAIFHPLLCPFELIVRVTVVTFVEQERLWKQIRVADGAARDIGKPLTGLRATHENLSYFIGFNLGGR